jgi:hypothetical protein
MNPIRGIYQNGQIHLVGTVDWPEGTPVRIELAPLDHEMGMREEDWPTMPEGIAALVARMEACEPIEMTDAEIADWQQSRREQAVLDQKRFEKIERMFE